MIGYFVVGPWEALFPYLLVVASSSFIYVAVADLLPQLQRRLPWRETLAQLAWLAVGLGVVVLVLRLHARRPLTPAAPRGARGQASRELYLTTSTGMLECVSTFCVSLPSSSADTPRRPCEAIDDQVAVLGLGVVEDGLPGVQRLDRVPLALHAAALRPSATAPCTRSAAMRSCAS